MLKRMAFLQSFPTVVWVWQCLSVVSQSLTFIRHHFDVNTIDDQNKTKQNKKGNWERMKKNICFHSKSISLQEFFCWSWCYYRLLHMFCGCQLSSTSCVNYWLHLIPKNWFLGNNFLHFLLPPLFSRTCQTICCILKKQKVGFFSNNNV